MKVGIALNMLTQEGRPDAAVLGDHLALGDLAEPRLQRDQELPSSRDGVGGLPVVDRDRDALVLDPGFRDLGGGGLHPRNDRGHQLVRTVLEPVEADVRDVRGVQERRHLLRTPSGDDRDRAEAPGELDEHLAGPVHGTRVLGMGHDLGEGAVEVEHDARDVRLPSEGVEVSWT